MVKKTVLDKFVRLQGYEIVKKKKGKWKNISEASKRTGLSRPTIYSLLEEYPEKPSKTKPKYVDVLEGWKILNKKDPISWDKEDFTKIWNTDKFISSEAGGFEEHYATSFHRLMRATERHDLLSKFVGHKRPPGGKKEWFLHDKENVDLCNNIEKPDVLVYDFAGQTWGARSSGMLATKVSDVHFEDHSITVYEPKTKQFVSKYPPIPFFKLLAKYVKDFDLQPKDPLFPNSYGYYNDRLGKAGEKAGLKKTVSTHILKHTFVSQGHRHNLSKETVIEMTGTEDRTLKKYYLSVSEKKIRHETQGIPLDTIPFYEWVAWLYPYFEQRYDELINSGATINGNH